LNELAGTPITADLLHGATELEITEVGLRPHRLPAWARTRAEQQVLFAESCPAGVRLVFRTTATVVEIDALRTTTAFRDMPTRPDGCYDLLVAGVLAGRECSNGGRRVVLDLATGATEATTAPSGPSASTACPATTSGSRSGCRTRSPPSWWPYAPTPQ
jgi:hypothetical protein